MKFINVTGYVASGSSAVIDFIREFDNTAVCKTEIRFIRDPFGIIDLDTALTYNWENERASYAIWNFLDRSKKMARFNRHVWSPMGHSYKKFLNKNYMKITKEYVEELTDYKATFGHYCDNYNFHYFSYVCNRIRRNIEKKKRGKMDIANRRIRKNYFAHPTDEQFVEATRKYIERLFEPISDNGSKTIILDQALPPDNLYYSERYFRDCMNILVTRDPRDIYTTNVYGMDVIAEKKGSLESGKRFVKYLRTIIEKENFGNGKLLIIRFEDLVLHYEETTKVISDFLGLDESKHYYKKEFLNPDKSCKNVGIWKKYYQKSKPAIDYIYNELKDLCWDGK